MVEGARLERVYTGNRIEGSNPSLSANCRFRIKSHSLTASQNHASTTLFRLAACQAMPLGLCHALGYLLG